MKSSQILTIQKNSTKGKQCTVNVAEDRNSLLVGGIPGSLSDQDTREALEKITGMKITEFDRRGSHGMSYVGFSTHSEAETARKRIAGSAILDRPLSSVWADSRPDANNTTNKTLFFTGLANSVTEDRLRGEIAFAVGASVNIIRCNICKHHETGQSRGFAFVEFGTREEALATIDRMKGKLIDNFQIAVDFARPPGAQGGPPFGGNGGGGGGGGGRRFGSQGRGGGSRDMPGNQGGYYQNLGNQNSAYSGGAYYNVQPAGGTGYPPQVGYGDMQQQSGQQWADGYPVGMNQGQFDPAVYQAQMAMMMMGQYGMAQGQMPGAQQQYRQYGNYHGGSSSSSSHRGDKYQDRRKEERHDRREERKDKSRSRSRSKSASPTRERSSSSSRREKH